MTVQSEAPVAPRQAETLPGRAKLVVGHCSYDGKKRRREGSEQEIRPQEDVVGDGGTVNAGPMQKSDRSQEYNSQDDSCCQRQAEDSENAAPDEFDRSTDAARRAEAFHRGGRNRH